GHEIGDARAVLGDANAVFARCPRIAVGHMAGTLLMGGGYEADARRRKKIERVHIGRSHDPEDVLHSIGEERFDERFRRCHSWHCSLPGAGARGPRPYFSSISMKA